MSQHLSAQFANFPLLEAGERIRILIKPDVSSSNKTGYTLKPSTRIVAVVDHLQDSLLTVNVEFNEQVNYTQYIHISTIDRIEKFISKEKRTTSAGGGFRKGFLIGAGCGILLGVIGLSTWEYREEASLSDVAIVSVILG